MIQHAATPYSLPDGQEALQLGVDATVTIAKATQLAGHQVEAEALDMGILPTRYARNMSEISHADQIKLLRSTVAQVGLGGLGGSLLELFLRAGIGHIKGADGDFFEESNLNRQSLSSVSYLGQSKVHSAKLRAEEINPSTTFSGHASFLDEKTLPEFLSGCHVAVDALGGLAMRNQLQQAAAQSNIPLVTGALAGWTGYVGVVLPGQCGPSDFMGSDNSAEEKLGCPAPAVACIASLMATETLKLITSSQSVLAGKIMIIDLKSMTFETISL